MLKKICKDSESDEDSNHDLTSNLDQNQDISFSQDSDKMNLNKKCSELLPKFTKNTTLFYGTKNNFLLFRSILAIYEIIDNTVKLISDKVDKDIEQLD